MRWVLMLLLLGGVGCQKSLFKDEGPRSPYERYAELRGEARPAKRMAGPGQEEPALRERLRPLE